MLWCTWVLEQRLSILHSLWSIFKHAEQVVVVRQGLLSAVATRMLKLMKMLIYVGVYMGLWNNILVTRSAFPHSLWSIFNHAARVVMMRQELCCLWSPVSDNLSQIF